MDVSTIWITQVDMEVLHLPQVNLGPNKYLSPRSLIITCRLHNQTTIDEPFIIMSRTKLIISK
jgi:hypothetical protein